MDTRRENITARRSSVPPSRPLSGSLAPPAAPQLAGTIVQAPPLSYRCPLRQSSTHKKLPGMNSAQTDHHCRTQASSNPNPNPRPAREEVILNRGRYLSTVPYEHPHEDAIRSHLFGGIQKSDWAPQSNVGGMRHWSSEPSHLARIRTLPGSIPRGLCSQTHLTLTLAPTIPVLDLTLKVTPLLLAGFK